MWIYFFILSLSIVKVSCAWRRLVSSWYPWVLVDLGRYLTLITILLWNRRGRVHLLVWIVTSCESNVLLLVFILRIDHRRIVRNDSLPLVLRLIEGDFEGVDRIILLLLCFWDRWGMSVLVGGLRSCYLCRFIGRCCIILWGRGGNRFSSFCDLGQYRWECLRRFHW